MTTQGGDIQGSMQPQTPMGRRIFHGWWLVLLAGLVMIVATVPLYHAMPVWAVALERHFGWNRTQLGLALTFTRLVALADPLVGYITDRFGPRRTVLTGLCILTAGTVLFGLTPNLLGYYAAILIMAVGQSLCGAIPFLVMLCRWFVRGRATAIAVFLMAPSLGALILVPVIAWSVDMDHAFPAWRLVVVVLAGSALVAAIPVFALLRNRPEDMGLLPLGVPPAEQSVSFSIGRTLRTPAFWLIALGDALSSMVVLAVMTSLGLLMSDRGFTVQATAWMVTAYTVASIVFQLVGGYSGDRAAKRVSLAAFALVQAVGVLALVLADSLAMFLAFAVIFGAGSGGRGLLSLAILPDYFGTAALGRILGFSAFFASILLLVGSPLTGFLIGWLDGYTVPLMVLAGLNLLGALLFLMARPPSLPSAREAQAGPA